jgi:hypothetical protein
MEFSVREQGKSQDNGSKGVTEAQEHFSNECMRPRNKLMEGNGRDFVASNDIYLDRIDRARLRST